VPGITKRPLRTIAVEVSADPQPDRTNIEAGANKKRANFPEVGPLSFSELLLA
jgi:hypothetical protein